MPQPVTGAAQQRSASRPAENAADRGDAGGKVDMVPNADARHLAAAQDELTAYLGFLGRSRNHHPKLMKALLREMEVPAFGPVQSQCNQGRPSWVKPAHGDIEKLFGLAYATYRGGRRWRGSFGEIASAAKRGPGGSDQ